MNWKHFLQEKPLHLLAFPVFFVLNHFFSIVTPDGHHGGLIWWILNFTGAILMCITMPFLLYRILAKFVVETNAGITTTFVFLPFFFFQDTFLFLNDLTDESLRLRWAIPLLVGIPSYIIYRTFRSAKPLLRLNQYLNTLSILLLIYTTLILLGSFSELKPRRLVFSSSIHSLDCQDCPDIYFFLLDSYTSNKSLRDYFEFNNNDFTDGLKGLFFEVTDTAKSVHDHTEYSIAATLNLNQIPELSTYKLGLNEAIENSSVSQSLEKSGYKINNYSIFKVSGELKYYSVEPEFTEGFMNRIFNNSICSLIYKFYFINKLYDVNTEILKRMTEQKYHRHPTFNYAHLLSPHPPFVMDEKGQKIPFLKQRKFFGNPESYINEIKGLNLLVLSSISSILESDPGAIVIVAGDHGYRFLNGPFREKESHATFLAYHGPGQNKLNTLIYSNDIFQLIFSELGIKRTDLQNSELE